MLSTEPSPALAESAPRPGWILIICSWLVILVCLFLISIALAMFRIAYDPCYYVCGAMILPLPSYLAFLQYCGTFRGDATSAYRAAIILVMVALFLLYITVINLQPFSFLFAIGCVVTAWLNRRWYTLLYEKFWSTDPPVKNRFTIRELMGAMTAVAIMTALASWLVDMFALDKQL